MARGRKTSVETLEQQIEKAQEKVIRTKSAYDNAVESLQKLLDKRDAKRKEVKTMGQIREICTKTQKKIGGFLYDKWKTKIPIL